MLKLLNAKAFLSFDLLISVFAVSPEEEEGEGGLMRGGHEWQMGKRISTLRAISAVCTT